MKISPLTKWRREHPRLTARIFPPLPPLSSVSSPQENEPGIVDLRDRAEQKKLCGGIEFFTAASQEPWWRIVLGVLVVAALGVLVWVLAP